MGLILVALFGALVYRYFTREVKLRDVLLALAGMVAAVSVVFWLHYSVYPMVTTAERVYVTSFHGALTSWGFGIALSAVFYALREREMPKVLLWLGKVCYSIYLMQGVFGTLPRTLSPWIGLPVLVGGTLCLSVLTYRWIELPMINLGHRLFPRRGAEGKAL